MKLFPLSQSFTDPVEAIRELTMRRVRGKKDEFINVEAEYKKQIYR